MRGDPDPIRRGRRATELLTVYQQRAAELARLRRAAIEDAHQGRGMSYAQIAAAMGITGPHLQIRGSAPAPERAFFGIGPVSVGVPLRHGVTDQQRRLIAAEDAQTGVEIARLLAGYGLAVTRYQIEPGTTVPPPGDAVVICGPKTALVGAALLAQDRALDMGEYAGRWPIVHRGTGEQYRSPAESGPRPRRPGLCRPPSGRGPCRRPHRGHPCHRLAGSRQYLAGHLAELFAQAGDMSFSLVVRASYDGLAGHHRQQPSWPGRSPGDLVRIAAAQATPAAAQRAPGCWPGWPGTPWWCSTGPAQ